MTLTPAQAKALQVLVKMLVGPTTRDLPEVKAFLREMGLYKPL